MISIRISLAVVLLACLCGCGPLIVAGAGAGAGVATYSYVTGDLEVEYAKSYESVWDAAVRALQELDISVEGKTKDGVSGTIEARRATGKKVVVKVKNKGPSAAVVNIKVGTFGDENASLVIKGAIDRQLGTG